MKNNRLRSYLLLITFIIVATTIVLLVITWNYPHGQNDHNAFIQFFVDNQTAIVTIVFLLLIGYGLYAAEMKTRRTAATPPAKPAKEKTYAEVPKSTIAAANIAFVVVCIMIMIACIAAFGPTYFWNDFKQPEKNPNAPAATMPVVQYMQLDHQYEFKPGTTRNYDQLARSYYIYQTDRNTRDTFLIKSVEDPSSYWYYVVYVRPDGTIHTEDTYRYDVHDKHAWHNHSVTLVGGKGKHVMFASHPKAKLF